ncbi:efflux RND transporter permease subunit [Verrucomicrobiaceae bacterium N1E253]|uniref:Efflux RND transporter permease subunit n=1 Tax=Oceaniferula marina TaxID=2748318 RepID=A0A851GCF7_9BACT|nr:efflux RND transporter permease subunit [Oceaniferula marina]NWK54859.1 efflux RND transporter permease subunit [Oceaniferula marina]
MLRWFARNDYAANFLMVAILLAGAYAVLFKIPTEVSPSYRMSFLKVNVPLPGGTPNEVESKVVIPIENALKGLSGIKYINAEARRGKAEFHIGTEEGADQEKLRTEIESRINKINTFPREIEPPRIYIPDTAHWMEVISVVVSGDMSEKDLLAAARQVRDDLTALPGISKVDVIGTRDREVSIEINQETLQDYGLTLDSVSRAIQQNSMDLSAGSIKTDATRVLLRSTNQALNRSQFEQIIIHRGDGAEIKLGDVANIKDSFDEQRKVTRFNGERSVIVEVKRLGDEKALKISDLVHQYVEESASRFPKGVKLHTWDDDSVSLRGRISTLFWNLLQGCVLVFILLSVFLRLSLAIWVIIGIPVAFAGGLMLMPTLGITANIMSLFGFIIVLGIVVDDAIVTGEHIFSKLKTGMDPLEASVTGAKEIAVPVTFGVLTTVVAFIPLAYITGWWGTFAKQIPFVVIPVLVFSLVESKLVLPSHLKHLKVNRTSKAPLTRIQQGATRLLEGFVARVYQPLLRFAVRWRYVTLSIFCALGFGTYGVLSSNMLGFQSLPSVDRYYIYARLAMMEGTNFDQTTEKVEEITEAAYQLRTRFTDGEGGPSLIGNVMSSTGGWPSWGHAKDTRGYVLVEILPPSKRKSPGPKNQEIADAWRDLVGEVQGAQSFSIRTERSGGGFMSERDDVEIELRGQNDEVMIPVAREMQEALQSTEGVRRTSTSIENAQNEFQIKLLPYGRDLGLTQESLARQVRRAFYGEQAQRIQRGEDSVRVMVRLPKHQRESLHTLDNLQITLPNKSTVNLHEVADITQGHSPPTIRRRDGSRYYTISAVPKSRDTNITDIGNAITPKLDAITAAHPGTSWRFDGFLAEDAENQQRFAVLAALLIFTLYTLLAIPFRSLSQPIFVLLAIPFGAVGAVIGHMALGITPSWLSYLGMLALAGVVVNDSLVMVDFTNRRRNEGKSAYDAVIHSGSARFRPILLTSLTTFAGLLPLIFERSIQAQFLIPMAVSLAFGIMFATFITLFLIPCAYLATEDIKRLLGKAYRWYTRPFTSNE